MTSYEPDSAVQLPLLRQAWRTVTFVHWRYPPSVVQPMLPPGLTADEHDGSAWVTMILLEMRDVRLSATPAVPNLSTFPETNLRTYVLGPGGRQGLWFFSLDAASTWITVGARLLLGLPYFRARLGIGTGDGVRYTGMRGGRHPAAYRVHAWPGPGMPRGEREIWLTHRWRAYTEHAGLLLELPVRHEPWPLRAATTTVLDQSLTAAAGLPSPNGDPLVHYSEGVAGVAFGAARPVRGR